MTEQFDWNAYLSGIKPVNVNPNVDASNYSYDNIAKTLKSGKSFTESAFPSVLPMLQPGMDPYLQQAIDDIVAQGKQAKARVLSDVTTEAQKRGLTGSSIESGDLAQAGTNYELGQQGQISGMLSQAEQDKRNQLVSFLTQAYGIDVQQANQMAITMAQLMGEKNNQVSQEDMFGRSLDAQKGNIWDKILPAIIQGGATILAKK